MSAKVETRPDGRLQRGEASRAAILGAACQVIVDAGVGALTHREVARTAGVSLARVSYHFPRAEELLVASAACYLAGFDARLVELAESSRAGERSIVDACTDFLVELVGTDRAPFERAVEVRFALHRRGQPVDDGQVLAVIASFGVDEQVAAAIFAAMFGFATLAATGTMPSDRAHVRDYVRLILQAMT